MSACEEMEPKLKRKIDFHVPLMFGCHDSDLRFNRDGDRTLVFNPDNPDENMNVGPGETILFSSLDGLRYFNNDRGMWDEEGILQLHTVTGTVNFFHSMFKRLPENTDLPHQEVDVLMSSWAEDPFSVMEMDTSFKCVTLLKGYLQPKCKVERNGSSTWITLKEDLSTIFTYRNKDELCGSCIGDPMYLIQSGSKDILNLGHLLNVGNVLYVKSRNNPVNYKIAAKEVKWPL